MNIFEAILENIRSFFRFKYTSNKLKENRKMNIFEAILGGRKTKQFELGERKIVLQTLTTQEQNEINKKLSYSFPNTSADAVFIAEMLPTLSKSLVSVVGVPVSNWDDVAKKLKENEKLTVTDAVEEIFSKASQNSISTLFNFYLQLLEEDRAERDELVNFTQSQKEDSSGN